MARICSGRLPAAAGGLDAVEFRHLRIHEDEIVVAGLDGGDGLEPVRGPADRIAGLVQEGHDEPTVLVEIVHHEDAPARCIRSGGTG
jgi:hypothetical protein